MQEMEPLDGLCLRLVQVAVMEYCCYCIFLRTVTARVVIVVYRDEKEAVWIRVLGRTLVWFVSFVSFTVILSHMCLTVPVYSKHGSTFNLVM